jgi:hypothetical protein
MNFVSAMPRPLRIARAPAATVAIVPGMASVPGLAPELESVPGATVELEGDSTLHRYRARARKLSVAIRTDAGRVTEAAQPPSVEGLVRDHAVAAFVLTVPIAGLTSGERDLDVNMRQALRGDQHPEIHYEMVGYDVRPARAAGARLAIELRGRLSIAGIARDMELTVDGLRTPDGLRFTGSRDLLMTDFGIKPPRLMLGALKTADRVTVRFDVTLRVRPTP